MTIAGQISSANGGAGGKIESGFDGGSLDSATRFPSSSLNYAPAARGEIVISSSLASVADGGVNQAASSDIESLKNTFKVGVISGGGGAGSLGGEGGVGGGSFALLCKQGITVSSSGVITLDGASGVAGGGGGAGGLVVLATNGTLANQGNIRARGGVGGATSNVSAGGGGGGGGIVNLVAALIQNTGTISVSGGIGAAAGSLPGGLSWRSGGGAGGSLGGVGGNGGNVINSSNTSTVGNNGANGQTFQTTVTGADVAALLF